MAVKVVRDLLLAASSVTDIVGQRISPVLRAQAIDVPCIVLTRVAVNPSNVLHGAPTLDANRVQVDSFAETYAQARTLADAVRAVLEAQDISMDSEVDNFEPDVAEYRITQDFLVWT